VVEHGVSRTAGKWGRAISIVEDTPTAQMSPEINTVKISSSDNNGLNMVPNDNLIDLYSVGHEKVTRAMCDTGVDVPFQHMLHLLGPQGEIIRVSALFDGCAMVSAMCTSIFKKVKHRLGAWGRSEKRLRMENGTIIPSQAVWKDSMQIGNIVVKDEFEVFDSEGSWAFLLGKPTL
jgi:hypothetical protein